MSPSSSNMTNPPTAAAAPSDGVTRRLSGALAVSLVAIALMFIVVAVGATQLVGSALAGSIGENRPREMLAKLVAEHDKKVDEWTRRIDKRSPFFFPSKPQTQHDQKKATEPIAVPPRDPGPPNHYTGPSIAWVIGDDVYFSKIPPTLTEKYMCVHVGEERDGVRVISTIQMPGTVHVGHAGGEYDVKVFGEGIANTNFFPDHPASSFPVEVIWAEGSR